MLASVAFSRGIRKIIFAKKVFQIPLNLPFPKGGDRFFEIYQLVCRLSILVYCFFVYCFLFIDF